MKNRFLAQQQAFARDPYPSLEQRKRVLGQLIQMLRRRQTDFAQALADDFGQRAESETRLLEVFPSLELIRYNLRQLPRWMKRQKRSTSLWFFPARNEVIPWPKGVIGIIVPWNYPLFLALGPLVQALAAGNRVMLKLPEQTPAFSPLLQQALSETLPQERCAAVLGGPETGAEFAALPWDHLFFTGSTQIGKKVMAAAAKNLTPLTLELGGKSPALLFDDADFSDAATKIVTSKSYNGGQTCVAPDYVLLPKKRQEEFIEACRQAFFKLYPHWRKNPDYTAIINTAHYNRLQELLSDAKALGAEVLPLAKDSQREAKRVLALHLVLNPPCASRLMKEEIFGPILPILGYENLTEAKNLLAQNPKPLAFYAFSQNLDQAKKLALATPSGGVALNDCVLHIAQEDLPFGGVGPSGLGQYHAAEGFYAFCQLKPIFQQASTSLGFLVRPPYGARIKALLKAMIR